MSQYFRYTPVFASTSAQITATASSGGGANAIASVTATGSTQTRAYAVGVAWSYTDTPSSGRLRLLNGTSSGTLLLDLDVTAAGPGSFFPPAAIGATAGSRLTAELLQAGSSVIGKLNLYGYVK